MLTPTPDVPAPPRTGAIRVLVIDDDEDVPVLVRAALAHAEYLVDWVADYDGALEAVRTHDYGALLIDYRLGGRNGIELLTELQLRRHRAAMIILTNIDDRSVDAAALDAGAADFILKNEVTQARLERAIRYARERTGQLAALQRSADAAGREASIDAVTGLGTRRAFDQDLGRLVDAPQPGGLVLVDVDELKQINDRLGHAMGDVAIRVIADNLRDARRTTDTTYRIGGDELAAVVSGPDTAGLGRRLERLLTALAGEGFLVSASVGWAERRPDDTAASLFARADADLYAHKRARPVRS